MRELLLPLERISPHLWLTIPAGAKERGQNRPPWARPRSTIRDRLGGESEEVLLRRLQSERVKETRDRAERGSVVRGSDQASVAPKRTSSDAPAM